MLQKIALNKGLRVIKGPFNLAGPPIQNDDLIIKVLKLLPVLHLKIGCGQCVKIV